MKMGSRQHRGGLDIISLLSLSGVGAHAAQTTRSRTLKNGVLVRRTVGADAQGSRIGSTASATIRNNRYYNSRGFRPIITVTNGVAELGGTEIVRGVSNNLGDGIELRKVGDRPAYVLKNRIDYRTGPNYIDDVPLSSIALNGGRSFNEPLLQNPMKP